jgi:hypothetical protein
LFSGVNTKACASGASRPNNEGPNRTPAIISQTTCGCLRYFWPSQPTTRHAARMSAICRKNVIDSFATPTDPSLASLLWPESACASSGRAVTQPLNVAMNDPSRGSAQRCGSGGICPRARAARP